MNKNVTDAINWAETDILVTTPKLFYRIIEAKHDEKVEVAPKYFVLD
jgi:hypothetical protein